ncbi:asparagine synthase (glutamine-hydrolyzing) [Aetokthonos hydrillicola Thurmond2011]|jgi:asparagine synthase (glutamine-hydrolysing)|uniref:asparagine synthase (glutamine-hydrolyzing) n=1 Tax=Aetokthonos hydrillicola Thurmond2011 TaxID=2712845 RepID=A0AAP5I3K5_9CYAN|nr:asparagine synthase (glutamine-hydrolyzing) [Aetokthonos hydrillicola]MBW4588162.1 asparagine synthase (glutamine-hydrolyzing) [Aetokthonos hydrillicola CCALA 1050]MDR9893154.1 asparagine synthase (glutamine-hydrolyzing) [Aetokthonos hydrillicola Thurmond2011]
MCGIVGLFSKHKPISESSLRRGMDCLKHRGPDGQNFWISGDQRVALGHTRLSIIDLENGEQPITNRDETLRIVVNGEFYDFERVQRDLKRWGNEFKTNSDSEIALHLYNEFGTQCLHHLRGEFAFIIWDERHDLLFAARDRFGIKPLYYTTYGDVLYLASEVKALFKAGVEACWDHESFWQFEHGLLAPGRTFFANVHQLPPGYFLLASRYGMQLHRYWDFNYPLIHDSLPQYTEDDYIEQLRHTLDEAIQLRLKADVPVSFYLSGGLDSSTVLAMAARHSPSPVTAFTIAFDHEGYNEEPLAREMAAHTGANLQTVPIVHSDLAEHFADSIWHCEMLCINGNTAAKYLLSRAVRDAGYKVLLTGEGSDEIFGGYAHFRQDMLLYNQQGQDEQTVKLLLEKLTLSNKASVGLLLAKNNSSQALSSIQPLLGFVPSWIQASAESYLTALPLYSSEFIAQFSHKDAYRLFFNQIDVEGQLKGREPVHQSLYLWSKTILPNYLLRLLGDGVEMAHSIEGRLPFLDHKVVELVCKMPASLKIRGLTEKYVLREAAKPLITDTMYNRQKHPFLAPPSTLKRKEPLQQLVQDTLRSSGMSCLPFYNHAAVIRLLDELPTMSESQLTSIETILMKILSAYILQERFGLVH